MFLRADIRVGVILQVNVHRTLSLALHNLHINFYFGIYYGRTCKRFLSIAEVAVTFILDTVSNISLLGG